MPFARCLHMEAAKQTVDFPQTKTELNEIQGQLNDLFIRNSQKVL